MTSLKPEFRAVAVLRLIQGFSTREVADMLGIEKGTVLSRLSRAKAQLADGLREDFGND
jgi:RNA polymerase sigma-70 factor (ECF subfamily)